MTHVEPYGTENATRAAREDSGEVHAGQLRAIIERAERLREERKTLDDDLKELFAEARGNGFDVPTIKEILKLRAQDPDKRVEKETLLDIYRTALGMA